MYHSIEDFMSFIEAKNHGEKEFHQAVHEVVRSEEHTSELQSRTNLVCRLLLEKKKKTNEK